MWIFAVEVVCLGTWILLSAMESHDEDRTSASSRVSSSTAATPSQVSRNVAATCTSALRKNSNTDSKVNGVILFLAGKNEPFFLSRTLPLLEAHFLVYFSYPVHIFHEDMPEQWQTAIRDAIPSACRVSFEDVGRFWRELPDGVTEKQLAAWMRTPPQRRYQGRGYRIMCRFWAGLVWRLPSLDVYEYYWRLDTDSYLTSHVPCDVFKLMQVNHCVYGYRSIRGENPRVVWELWPTFLKWAKAALSPAELAGLTGFALNASTKKYEGVMYYNNFELGAMKLKRHQLYHSLFQFLDTEEPRGIMRYRWGDAPIHTLAVETVMQHEGWKKCQFDKRFAGYMHGKR
ncbi:alpha-1,2-mannosyltransferase [Trypanosoma rangeli]|uniref:Alpha-1,2-mannosyltransferase n=1 Tax=Trypanosoma rangeli TaxID=5698 RepID=A0A3R7NZS3_TRYRA|nr:alpha-1,2-mannosyltransferase [Trypanosoma rangeli]RNF10357.1 alpha-1,2-mannosyltransferase [Trypanosoma rangeli]|eukprot:RNF10357.1 alpha-1,2-mannosyltransferase [Trypanosoma rangeli]